MEYIVKVTSIENVTHDVKKIRCEKPGNYFFIPGQATEVSINNPIWKQEKRPFTFTSLNEWPFLEFIIKVYSSHCGVTNELDSLKVGDELIIGDVWGAIEYKGPGYFIAGGAGITPFVAILRQLKVQNALENNVLLFSNKSVADIILERELTEMLSSNVIYTITDEANDSRYHNGFIDEAFLKRHVVNFSGRFYLCGPPKMVEAMRGLLKKLGASSDAVIFEN